MKNNILPLTMILQENNINNKTSPGWAGFSLIRVGEKLLWEFDHEVLNSFSIYENEWNGENKEKIKKDIHEGLLSHPFLDDRTFLMWDEMDTTYPFDEEAYKKAVERWKEHLHEHEQKSIA